MSPYKKIGKSDDFGGEEVVKARTDGKGIDEKEEEYLQKQYKEFLKSLFTQRIIDFLAPSHQMPTNLKIYDGFTNPMICNHFEGKSQSRRLANAGKVCGKDVLEVMHISAFMSTSKCPELAMRFFDQVPKTVTEMMKRVDDFVKFEEAFKSTELPKGEFSEKGQGMSYRGSRPPRAAYEGRQHRTDNYNNFNHRDHF
ncbi:hypothetical protein Tco_0910133 [Tanacetum coccineum]|uniref:Uncharacterized protein n=1 Tax=Tanacetum coccineum TaxID=301880 RepID=A0ABQ5CSE1_9ASTR